MKERPILFAGSMISSILEDRKTQTRRPATSRHPITLIGPASEQDDPSNWGYFFDGPDHNGYMVLGRGLNERHDHGRISIPAPHGEPGDRMWCKETWRTGRALDALSSKAITRLCVEAGYSKPWAPILYQADERTENEDTLKDFGGEWGKLRPSIFMPRWASRLSLEVTEVRVERLQEISHDDALAEGVLSWVESLLNHPDYDPNGRLSAYPVTAFSRLWDLTYGKRAAWVDNDWVWAYTFGRIS